MKTRDRFGVFRANYVVVANWIENEERKANLALEFISPQANSKEALSYEKRFVTVATERGCILFLLDALGVDYTRHFTLALPSSSAIARAAIPKMVSGSKPIGALNRFLNFIDENPGMVLKGHTIAYISR